MSDFPSAVDYKISSYCSFGNCVEVGRSPEGAVVVRDTKDRAQEALTFTDEERQNFARLLESGFVDTFREFEKGPGHYTWWSQMMNCRARNIGWRVDYFVVSKKLRPSLKSAWISPDVMGSDHCPVGLEIG